MWIQQEDNHTGVIPLHQFRCKHIINNAPAFNPITQDYPYDCAVFLSHSYCATLPRDFCINYRDSFQSHKMQLKSLYTHAGMVYLTQMYHQGSWNEPQENLAKRWQKVKDTGMFKFKRKHKK